MMVIVWLIHAYQITFLKDKRWYRGPNREGKNKKNDDQGPTPPQITIPTGNETDIHK